MAQAINRLIFLLPLLVCCGGAFGVVSCVAQSDGFNCSNGLIGLVVYQNIKNMYNSSWSLLDTFTEQLVISGGSFTDYTSTILNISLVNTSSKAVIIANYSSNATTWYATNYTLLDGMPSVTLDYLTMNNLTDGYIEDGIQAPFTTGMAYYKNGSIQNLSTFAHGSALGVLDGINTVTYYANNRTLTVGLSRKLGTSYIYYNSGGKYGFYKSGASSWNFNTFTITRTYLEGIDTSTNTDGYPISYNASWNYLKGLDTLGDDTIEVTYDNFESNTINSTYLWIPATGTSQHDGYMETPVSGTGMFARIIMNMTKGFTFSVLGMYEGTGIGTGDQYGLIGSTLGNNRRLLVYGTATGYGLGQCYTNNGTVGAYADNLTNKPMNGTTPILYTFKGNTTGLYILENGTQICQALNSEWNVMNTDEYKFTFVSGTNNLTLYHSNLTIDMLPDTLDNDNNATYWGVNQQASYAETFSNASLTTSSYAEENKYLGVNSNYTVRNYTYNPVITNDFGVTAQNYSYCDSPCYNPTPVGGYAPNSTSHLVLNPYTTYNFTRLSQSVISINKQNLTSPDTLKINFYDDDTLEPINTSLVLVTINSSTINYGLSSTSALTNHTFQIYPGYGSLTTPQIRILYAGEEYAQRSYYTTLILSNVTQTINLYLLSSGSSIVFTVKNEDGTRKSGVNLVIEKRYYDSEYRIVQGVITDDYGVTVAYLKLNEQYRIKLYKDGVLLNTVEKYITTTDETITLTPSSSTSLYNKGIPANVTFNFNNATNITTLTVYDFTNHLSNMTLLAKSVSNGLITTLCNENKAFSNGTSFTCDLTDFTSSNTYVFKITGYYDDGWTLDIYNNVWVYQSRRFDTTGVLLAFLLIGTLAVALGYITYSGSGLVIGASFGFLLSNVISLTSFSYELIIGLFVVSGLVLYLEVKS